VRQYGAGAEQISDFLLLADERRYNSARGYEVVEFNATTRNATSSTHPETLLERIVEKIQDEAFQGRQPLSTGFLFGLDAEEELFGIPFGPPERNSPWAIANQIQNLAQSARDLNLFDATFNVKVSMVFKRRASGCTHNFRHVSEYFIDIQTDDAYCIPRSILIGINKIEMSGGKFANYIVSHYSRYFIQPLFLAKYKSDEAGRRISITRYRSDNQCRLLFDRHNRAHSTFFE
jgi:hypothetical protein